MTKDKKLGTTNAIEVEQGNLITGALWKSSKQPFCDGSHKGSDLFHRFSKLRKQKNVFAHASKQIISHL